MYLLLQITKTKCYKLNITRICTKITNNDGIKQFLKKFHSDDIKKIFLMKVKKVKKVP